MEEPYNSRADALLRRVYNSISDKGTTIVNYGVSMMMVGEAIMLDLPDFEIKDAIYKEVDDLSHVALLRHLDKN